ncbi:MAG: hypothetical protein Q4G59_09885 [Planctomycetia bacterium]|nr:hypothetical protein [Planctomycetia bacterium]
MAVRTVLGDVDASTLGITTPHEHIFIDMEVFFAPPKEIGLKNVAYEPVSIEHLGILKRNPFALKDNVVMMDEETQLDEIMYFRCAGGKTIVDATTVGIGRDPILLRNASVLTGLNVVAGAGFYVDGAQDEETKALSIEQMENQIVEEIEKGIGHSGVRAGIIGEIGVSHIMTPFEKRSVQAACRAQKRTGAPLTIHINPWSTQGLAALDIVKEEKVDTSKVVICHIDVENNEDYIFKLLDSGAYIEFDNFGKEMFTDRWDVKPGSGRFVNDWQRVELVAKLVEKGYLKQLLLSTDVCLKSLLHAYGGWGYDHILTHIVHMLDEVGVNEEQRKTILIANPARWLDTF